MLGVVSITTLCSSYLLYRGAVAALRDDVGRALESAADDATRELERWLANQRALLDVVATLDDVVSLASTAAASAEAAPPPGRGAAPEQVQAERVLALLQRLRRGPADAEELQLLSAVGGRVLVSTVPANVGTYAVSAPYFREGRRGRAVQPVYPSPSTGRPRLSVATPVRDAAGQAVGVVVAHLDLQAVERVLRPASATRDGVDAYLVNSFREFVSAARFGRSGYRRGVTSRAIEEVRQGRSGTGEYATFDGQAVIGVWRWLPGVELGLLVEQSRAVAIAPARQLLGVVIVTSVAAMLLLSFGVVAVMRRVTRPVLQLADAAARVAAGDFTPRAEATSDDEVGLLATSFNRMTEQLDQLVRGMREQVEATRGALRQAHESQSLLQSIVDNASTIICVVGMDERQLQANQRFRQLFLSTGAAAGHPLSDVLTIWGGGALTAQLAEARRADTAIERECELGDEAERHHWQVATFPLRTADGTTFAMGLIGTDLTERARAEEERRLTDARVQQARKLESLGVMAGGIAHDFNNILGAILANADLASHEPHLVPDVREALREIVTAARRASELTRQMLAYAGRASFETSPVDVHEILRDMARLVRASHSKRVELTLELGDAPAWTLADPSQLSQVALNLLTNAMEAIGPDVGRVAVSSAVVEACPTLGASPTGLGWHRISVTDTGHGMTEETKRRIFEPFFSTKQPGRGLGLSAVVGILRGSGGALDVHSVPGHGTRFDVYLPRYAAPESVATVAPGPGTTERRGTALVVDDEEALLSVTRRMLEGVGFTVLTAASGEDGVATFRRHAGGIDLVILDLTMPGMDGFEALHAMRGLAPTLPIIVASGYDARDRVEDLRIPGVFFLQKPYGRQALLELARAAVPPSRAEGTVSPPRDAPSTAPGGRRLRHP
ncbi:MAG TPA: response regulator [Gemmatimonadaceae bacterium]|nr:response regulator [Gemmatimonadaceae bacterium]